MNTAAATSVTREGRAFWLAKTVPASANLQVKGKFYFGSSIALLGVSSTGIAGGIILGLPLLGVLAAVIVALLIGGAISAIGVTMDMTRPKLYWESERQAIKQNMNAFLITMVGFAIVIVYAITAVLLGSSGLPDILIWVILIAIALLVFIAFEKRMSAKAERAYDNIEF
jgi:ABC-2 type transport system permease protein